MTRNPQARLIRGDRLTDSQRSQVLLAFPYRPTFENQMNHPDWVRRAGGKVTMSDDQWVREHAFRFTKAGRLAVRGHAEPIYMAENPGIRAQVRRLSSGQIQLKIPLGRRENPMAKAQQVARVLGRRVVSVARAGIKRLAHNPRTEYEVIVGNIGTVYSGGNYKDAFHKFSVYVQQSIGGYGRASGESVTIMRDGEIVKEHVGPASEYNPRGRCNPRAIHFRGGYHAVGDFYITKAGHLWVVMTREGQTLARVSSMQQAVKKANQFMKHGVVVENPDSRPFYTIKKSDVGKATIKAFGRRWRVDEFIGHIGAYDVGKRVVQTSPGVLQVENEEQLRRRVGNPDKAYWQYPWAVVVGPGTRMTDVYSCGFSSEKPARAYAKRIKKQVYHMGIDVVILHNTGTNQPGGVTEEYV